MNIVICQQGTFSLLEPDRFDSFKVIALATRDASEVQSSLEELGDFADEDHIWVDAATLVARSGRDNDKDWLDGLGEMVSLGRKYGFVQDDPLRIRAHIEWQDGG